MAPYCHTTGWPMVTHDALTEEVADGVVLADLVAGLLGAREGAVVCTHRPVLPAVLEAIGLPDDVRLEAGEMLVVHHRKGRIVATERHLP